MRKPTPPDVIVDDEYRQRLSRADAILRTACRRVIYEKIIDRQALAIVLQDLATRYAEGE